MKALKTRQRRTQQPDYAVPRLPEIYRKPLIVSLGHFAITDKMLGVRYRGGRLYYSRSLSITRYQGRDLRRSEFEFGFWIPITSEHRRASRKLIRCKVNSQRTAWKRVHSFRIWSLAVAKCSTERSHISKVGQGKLFLWRYRIYACNTVVVDFGPVGSVVVWHEF